MTANGAVVFTKIPYHPVHPPCRPMISFMSTPIPDPRSSEQAQADLLAALVSPPPIYPWAPHQDDAEAYFVAATLGEEDALIDTTLTEGWQRFSAQMDDLWAHASAPWIATITQRLKAQLPISLPDEILHTLATAVTTLEDQGHTYLDHLVACAQSVLPSWDAGDLAVLARPLAYSLRSGHSDILELNLRSIPPTEWHSLSDIERARLSLNLAALALKAAAQDP